MAQRRGWDPAWLNFAVTQADALPTLGREVQWETLYDEGGIRIEVASKESLLAMKLRANRPGRDTRDIRLLLALCGIATLKEAEDLYEAFYPADALPARAEAMVVKIFATPGELPAPLDPPLL